MNAIQKAAFAASSLIITLVGAALVTAPIAFAHEVPVVAYGACSAAAPQLGLAARTGCAAATMPRG